MAETFLIQHNDEKRVRKIVKGKQDLGITKLKQQFDWISNLDRDIKNKFPAILNSNFNKNIGFYDMEYFNMATFKDYIINLGKVNSHIKNVIDECVCLSKKISNKTLNIDCKNYIIDKHLNKMSKRCDLVSECDPTFNVFYNANRLIINGTEYLNYKHLKNELLKNEKFIKFVSPTKMHRSHGDFTLQNILIDDSDFMIIDPRGEEYDSIYYDISKIYQSCHGKYDLLYDDNYVCDFSIKDNIINYKFIENVELYDQLFNLFKLSIASNYELNEGWDLIARFFEASHLIAMAPFRYKENIEKTLICYCTGVKIMNDVLNEWKLNY